MTVKVDETTVCSTLTFCNKFPKIYEWLFMLAVNIPHCRNNQMSYMVIIPASQTIFVKYE